MSQLISLSPLDGRYKSKTKELRQFFSEAALIRYRLLVEVEYLISLSELEQIEEIQEFDDSEISYLRSLYKQFKFSYASQIKEIEKTTNHDVKAIEYFLKEKLESFGLHKHIEFVHFALTSEDINNIAYTLMLKHGIQEVLINIYDKLTNKLKKLSIQYCDIPLLSLTHGQPATPTTIGKEIAVFHSRLDKQIQNLKDIKLHAKLNGASANYASACVAYPDIDWINFSKTFIQSFDLKPNFLTTQIESHDSCAEVYDNIARINNIVKDLDQDMWLYISRKIFKLKKVEGEVGSSTMPHKVNPIDFENSEGNIGLANCLLRFMSDKLAVSRMQRDLTDSTVLRNQGVALGYSLLAYKSTLKGLSKLDINRKAIDEELDNHWEVLAEAIQTILRKSGHKKPYELLKTLTQGQEITKETIYKFVTNLDIDVKLKNQLLKLTPSNYIGLSVKLCKLNI